MQTNNTFAYDRVSEVITPDEVAIILRRDKATNALQFNVLVSKLSHSDPEVEIDTGIVYATAVGLVSMVAEKSVDAWIRGCQIIDAEAQMRNNG